MKSSPGTLQRSRLNGKDAHGKTSAPTPGSPSSNGNAHGFPKRAKVESASPSRDLAYVQVASSELTRDINRDLILELIRSMQPISRVDLARASGL